MHQALRHGLDKKLGCTLGRRCQDYHPIICRNAIWTQTCFEEKCRYPHPKGTTRKREDDIITHPQQNNTPKEQVKVNPTMEKQQDRQNATANQSQTMETEQNLFLDKVFQKITEMEKQQQKTIGYLMDRLERLEMRDRGCNRIDHLDAEIAFDGYTIFRADRINRSHGGVINYIRNDMAASAENMGTFFQRNNRATDNLPEKARSAEVETKLKLSHEEQQQREEKEAVSRIKENPRYFFSYARKKLKAKSVVGPLYGVDGEPTADPKQMANILRSQYESVFSNPNEEKRITNPGPFFTDSSNTPQTLSSISISEKDITEAIKAIAPDAAAGPDGFHAQLLRNCSQELAKPLQMLWSLSLQSGTVPAALKSAIITPIHKGGSRGLARDIDDNLEHAEASSFADDTRIKHQITCPEDAANIQGYLHKILDWASTNNMLLNGDKFELIRYGRNEVLKNSTCYEYNKISQ
ncbi:hypothetical protein O3P69_015546 [Scylla paramamosain]|uniref:C3H1-type domain-containing protein n=1 Tax=Scylla paramamosain TaxID=85552 RepID=A0AAW0SDM2_SCYPA